MSGLIQKTKNAFTRLHKNEDGMEALQTVLIIALAAIILAFAYKLFGGTSQNTTDTESSGGTVTDWISKVMGNLFKFK